MISLRKINSILIIVVVMLLACHGLLNTLLFFGLVGYSPIFKITGRWLFYPLTLHVMISLYLYVREKFKKTKRYPNLTKETTQQLLSGICIIIFAALHIISYSSAYETGTGQLYHIIVDNLLFISIALHLTVSVPRLLVSFGFMEGKNDYANAKSKIRLIIIIFLIVIFIAQATYYGGFI